MRATRGTRVSDSVAGFAEAKMPTGEDQNVHVVLVADLTNHPVWEFAGRRRGCRAGGLVAAGVRIIGRERGAIAFAESFSRFWRGGGGGDGLDHGLLEASFKAGDDCLIVLGETEPNQALGGYLPCLLL